MRYLKKIATGEVTSVGADDDQKFNDLTIQRNDDGTPVYVQTGAHDPAVKAVKVHGQDPPNGQQQVPADAGDKPGPVETNVQGTGEGVGSKPDSKKTPAELAEASSGAAA